MIVAGASSYPRIIDYQLISKIAKKNMSYFMVDIAHPVGLIASNLHPSPVPYADVVTTSTEKTLWGPHAGMIMTKKAFKNQVDQAVHPGTQSSVPINRIIQVALALLFAETSEFKDYASRVAKNAQVLADNFSRIENCLLFGGTDSHFVVIDVLGGFGLSGKEAEKVLEEIGIFTNRQVIPWEERRVYETSGLRIGTPSASARGLTEKDFDLISKAMINVLKNPEDVMVKQDAKEKVEKIAANHIPDFCGEY